jgi:rhomboid family GlyGly-CTERM serine protease
VAWLVVGLWLALPSLLVWPQHRLALQVLGWSAAAPWSDPWRWWSAAWPHLNAQHLLANLVGCGVVMALGWVADLPRRAAWAWLLAWPLTHLALAGQPGLALYGGLSGVLHAGVAVAASAVLLRRQRGESAIAAAVLAGLGVKLALEWWAEPGSPGALTHPPGWDMAVVPRAHLTGALAGLVCGVALCRRAPG